jgi:Zn-dependent peptidase ImmA (M78 family)
MNDLLASKAATSFRSELGLNNSEPIRFKSLLQKLNVITVFSPLSESFSGMAIKVGLTPNEERFMLVNSNITLGKQHFTVCHELYHLYIQPNFTSRLCITGQFDKRKDIDEYHADIFASYLLLPDDGLIENIPDEELRTKSVSLKTILYIENLYSCSRRALLFRLKSKRLIKEKDYEIFKLNVKRGALENGYSTNLYENGNHNLVLGNYGSIARDLFDADKISQSHYYSLLKDLGIDITKLEEEENGEY